MYNDAALWREGKASEAFLQNVLSKKSLVLKDAFLLQNVIYVVKLEASLPDTQHSETNHANIRCGSQVFS